MMILNFYKQLPDIIRFAFLLYGCVVIAYNISPLFNPTLNKEQRKYFLVLLSVYSVVLVIGLTGWRWVSADTYNNVFGNVYTQRFYNLFWYGFLWKGSLVLSGIATIIILWQVVFRRRDLFDKSLERYEKNVPKNVNFEKLYSHSQSKNPVTLLGYDFTNKQPAVILDEDRKKHVQVVGSTGSGKTHFVLLPMIEQDIKKGRGVIFIDAKGDLNTAKTVYLLSKAAGREKDFLIFSMSDYNISNTYNPLLLGNPTQLKDKIIGSMEFTEPHYKRECENGLQILFEEYLSKNKNITLPVLDHILKTPPKELTNFQDFFETHKKNISGIQNEIHLSVNTPFGYLFGGEEINLLDVYTQNKIVYFALNVLSYSETARRLGQIITGDINSLCGLLQGRAERKELAVYIDEYQRFGTQKFADTLAQGRSAGFMVTLAHQSIGDLDAISDTHTSQVRSNTNTKIVLKVNDPDTAEQFSEELGTYKKIESTRQTSISGIPQGAIMGNEKVVDELKVHPQEIKQLQTGQGYYKTPKTWGLVLLKPLFIDNLVKFELPEQTKTEIKSQQVIKDKEQEIKTNHPDSLGAVV